MSSELNSGNRSRVVSRRRTTYKARDTTFCEAGQLPAAYVDRAARIFILGPVADTIAGMREWVAKTPAGYVPDGRGHYLQGRNTWVARYTQLGSGRKVELRPASEWFGSETPTVNEARAVWSVLEWVGRKFNNGTVLSSPAATGRDWWVRTLPGEYRFESPPDHICDLIRSTSGQGRFEVIEGGQHVEGIHEMDGRLMYLALMRELPGNFVSLGPCSIGELNLYDRARYEISVTVRHDWEHVGLIGRLRDGKVTYPRTPGESWTTWVDGAELRLLVKYDWPVAVHQRMLFEQGKPLDKFARDIVKHIEDFESPTAVPVGRTVARCLRLMAIATLGAFVGRGMLVDQEAKLWDGPLPASARNVSTIDGTHYFQQLVAPRDPSLVQPQWSAAVWARARCRLLDGPGNTGALHMHHGKVLGMALDALYLTNVPNNWPDDGKPGRFRLKSSKLPEPGATHLDRPTTLRQLLS